MEGRERIFILRMREEKMKKGAESGGKAHRRRYGIQQG
jgi:hypothetical protein